MAYGSEKLLAQLRYRSSSLAGRVVRKERIGLRGKYAHRLVLGEPICSYWLEKK